MKKITKSFFAISLSTTIIFQNMMVISNSEETSNTQMEQTTSSSTSLDDLSLTSNANDDSNVLIDPLANPTNRPGYEENSKLKAVSLDASKPFSYPNVYALGKVTANTLNVRKGPSTSYDVLSTVNKGNVVQILSSENGWYKISYFYRKQVSSTKYDFVFDEGYVSKNYIDAVKVKEKGIDVSKWNGTIDWNKVKAYGIDYAIIRAGYSTGTVDPYFKSNIEGAIKAGVKVGVYWFSYAHTPEKAKQEAQKCLETIAPYKKNISYPVFFDFEQASEDYVKKQYNITVSQSLGTSMAKSFMDTVKASGYTPGLYTGIPLQKYFSDELLNSAYTWLAQYSYRASYPKQFSMWQYGDNAYVNGISGCVDINFTLGDPIASDNESDMDTPTLQSISSASVSNIDDKIYTGIAITPKVTVTLNNKTLKEDEDYKVTYSNNTNIGTGKITITGIGNYTGSKTINFNIVSPSINLASVSNITSKTYTGKAIKPKVTVTIDNKTLKENEDYKLQYSNNTSIGVAQVKITGIGNYTGTKTITFNIVPKTINSISLVKKTTNSIGLSWQKVDNATGYRVYRYNPKTNSYESLKFIKTNSTSYTDSNLNHASVYKYKVRAYKTVDGVNYYGKYSNEFTESTKVKKVENVKLNSTKDKSLSMSWSKVNNVDGYKVYKLDKNTNSYKLIKTIKDNSVTSFTDSNLSSATTYYYKIKAYKYLNGSTRHSDYSSTLKATTRPSKLNVSLTSPKSKSIKVSWTNTSKRNTGYQVAMSTYKDKSFKTIATTTNTSFTKGSLTKGKTYYFKVRAYKVVDGKKIYGSYSSVKSIKCK